MAYLRRMSPDRALSRKFTERSTMSSPCKSMYLILVLISLLGFYAIQCYPSQQLHNPYGSVTYPPVGGYQIPSDMSSSSNRVILMLLKEQCMRLVQEAGMQSLPDYCYYVLSGNYPTSSQLSYMYLQSSLNSISD
ncbi:hypothetical protein RRG08_012574 [Elysia crispata]|uniref:Uncharacterized protein n=1 Tax=Elysia crispata TaxID=231223 RepID=A0AAE1AP34_9GAST|nr:hypothetical protein RRG08_012574 [Elysia crispata]